MMHEVGTDFQRPTSDVLRSRRRLVEMVGKVRGLRAVGWVVELRAKLFRIVHLTPRGVGAKAWRLLRAESAGYSGATLVTMDRDVVSPREQWDGRCERWKGLSDVFDRIGDQHHCVRGRQRREDQRCGARGNNPGSRACAYANDASPVACGPQSHRTFLASVGPRSELCPARSLPNPITDAGMCSRRRLRARAGRGKAREKTR